MSHHKNQIHNASGIRCDIEERIEFVNNSNINYCLAHFDKINSLIYLKPYSDKFDYLIHELSNINSKRIRIAHIADLKRIAGEIKIQSDMSSWINFSNHLQIKWISYYLQLTNEFNTFETLIENEINKENSFFVFSTTANTYNIEIIEVLEKLKEEWGYTYNNETLDWIKKNNKKQLKWIYTYIGKIEFTEDILRLKLDLPTNEKEKFEYIYIILSLCLTFPNLLETEGDNDSDIKKPADFINRIKKSWQVYERRSLKKESPIYKALPTGTRTKLKKLSKEHSCSAEDMIEFMIDVYTRDH